MISCRTVELDGVDGASSIRPYEPNYLAWNGEPGIDDQVDARFGFVYPWTKRAESNVRWFASSQVYAAFGGRFSQVLRSQESAPVLARRYNPEIFLRFWQDSESAATDDYVDVGFGHDSNGQTINSEMDLQSKQQGLSGDGDDPETARRFISRGWDYVGVTARRSLDKSKGQFLYLKTRYFLEQGVFQDAEDYFEFENSDEFQRRAKYDGLTLIFRDEQFLSGDSDFRLLYSTGYERPLRSNTVRFEWTHASDTWPITVFAQTGYNNDFATYYTHTSSFGIGVELR